ncbi:MAG: Ig-like domain-containing protein [Thermoplasmata archaeon]|nr:Ig-like domain-containing protein [Thermoplasmata archaeon]
MNAKIIALLIVVGLIAAPASYYVVTSGDDDDGGEDVSLVVQGVDDDETLSGDVHVTFSASPSGGVLTITVDGDTEYFGLPQPWTWDTALLEDGEHQLTAIYEYGGKTATVSFTVSTENVSPSPPVVEMTSPSEGTHSGVRWIEFSVQDPEGDVESIEVIVDGSSNAVVPSAYGHYAWSVDLEDGDHTASVVAEDATGLDGSDSVAFVIDSRPPALVLTPSGGWRRPPVALHWTATDASDIEEYVLRVDGDEVYSGAGTTFTLDVEDGTHEVGIEATDAAGNVGGTTSIFNVDGTAPVPTLDIADGAVLGGVVTVAGDIVEEGPVEGTWLKVDGASVATSLPYDLDTAEWPEGEHDLLWGCEDRAGNSADVGITVTFDNTAPEVWMNLTDGGYIAGKVPVEGGCHDANGIAGSWLRVDDEVVATALPHELRTTRHADGDHDIAWGCEDAAGNIAEVKVTKRFDNTPPDAWLDNEEGDHVRGTIEIDGGASDAEELASTWLIMDGEEVSEALPHDVDTRDLKDGAHGFTWGAEDVAGNVREVEVHLFFDNTPPTIELAIPGGPSRGLVPVYIDVEDNLALEWWGILVDGETPEMEGGKINSTRYGDGGHEVQGRAADAAGNEALHNVTAVFDNTAPVVAIAEPDAGYVRGTIDLAMDASDDYGIESCNFTLDGEELTNATEGALDTTDLEDGPYELAAWVRDAAGNVGHDVVAIEVDNTPPEITDIDPVDGSRVRDEVTVSFAADDGSQIDELGIWIDGDRVAWDAEFAWDTNTSDDGWIGVTLMARDAAGNEAWCNVSYEVDNVEPPLVYIEYPVEGMAFRESFTLTINVTSSVTITRTDLYVDGMLDQSHSGLEEEMAVDTTGYGDGLRHINVTIVDDGGNENSSTVNVTFDNTPPEVEWLRPGGDRLWNATIRVDATDAETGIEWIAFRVNGTEIENGTSTEATFPEGRSDGRYDLDVWASDGVGNVEHVGKAAWLDLRWPSVAFESPENDTILRRTVEVVAVHEDWDIEEVGLFLDDEAVADGYRWTWDTTESDDGEHWLNLTATDRYGNSTTVPLRLGVDNTPPEMAFLGPEGYYVKGETDIEADVHDEWGVERVAFLLDDAEVKNGTGQIWTWDTGAGASGVHEVAIIGIDRAGNWNTTARDWFVDNTPPTVSITAPEEDDVVNGTVDISADASDNVEVDRVLFYANSELISLAYEAPWVAAWDTSDQPDGNYTLSAMAFDPAGNQATAVVNVTKGEERETLVQEPAVKVLDEYDLFGVERIVVTESRYQGAVVVSTLLPKGIAPAIDWQKSSATDMWINYTSLSRFSSEIAISAWDSPAIAVVVEDYADAIIAVPLSVFLDAPLLIYGTTTDEALWTLGTVYADQVLTVGDTPYNDDGAKNIDGGDVLSYALGVALLGGETPDYLVATNPNDVSDAWANTCHLSCFAGAFAALHRGVVLNVVNSDGTPSSASVVDSAIKAAYGEFEDLSLTPRFLNVVGDYKSVPHSYENHGFGSEPSDNRYADLDDDPTTVEVANGRVFGKGLDDMSYYLDRVINYRGYWDSATAPVAPAPVLVPGEWNNNGVIYMGWAAEFAEDSEQHCREYMRNVGWFNTKDDSDVAHAMATSQLMSDFAASNWIIINADHGMPSGTTTFDSGDIIDLNPSVAFGVSCSVGRTDGVDRDSTLTYTFLEKGVNCWLAPTRTAYGSFVQTYPYQPIAAPGLCYLYIRALIDDNLTSGEAYMQAKANLIQQDPSSTNQGTTWQYQHYGDPAWNPYEPNNEGTWL